MAKRSAAAIAAVEAETPPETGIDWSDPVVAWKQISAGFRKEIENVADSVTALAKQYGAMREKVVVVAPRLFAPALVKTDTGRMGGLFTRLVHDYGLSLADFARMIDNTVPKHARATDPSKPKGYLFHPTYASLAYMKRTYTQSNKPKGKQGKMDLATNLEVRALRTLLQLAASPETFWTVIEHELMLTPERRDTLQKRVGLVKPLFKINIKPQALTVDHMESEKKVQIEAAEGVGNTRLAANLRRSLHALEEPRKRIKRAS